MSMDLSICMGIGWLRFILLVVVCLVCFVFMMDGWKDVYDVVRHANCECMHVKLEWNRMRYCIIKTE